MQVKKPLLILFVIAAWCNPLGMIVGSLLFNRYGFDLVSDPSLNVRLFKVLTSVLVWLGVTAWAISLTHVFVTKMRLGGWKRNWWLPLLLFAAGPLVTPIYVHLVILNTVEMIRRK
jgi:hypothetical protein